MEGSRSFVYMMCTNFILPLSARERQERTRATVVESLVRNDGASGLRVRTPLRLAPRRRRAARTSSPVPVAGLPPFLPARAVEVASGLMSALLVAGGPRVRTPSPNSSRGGEWFYERTVGGWRSSGPHPCASECISARPLRSHACDASLRHSIRPAVGPRDGEGHMRREVRG